MEGCLEEVALGGLGGDKCLGNMGWAIWVLPTSPSSCFRVQRGGGAASPWYCKSTLQPWVRGVQL